MNHAVWVKSGEVQCRREEVAPAQAPQHWAFHPRQDASEEDRCAGVVGEVGAARHLMKGAGREPTAWQSIVQLRHPEGKRAMCRACALDPRDPGTQILEDDGLVHDIGRLVEG